MKQEFCRLSKWLMAAGVACASLSAIAAVPAEYPVRQVRLLVGFTPGGGTDNMARAMGAKMSERLGVPIVIENRPGAGGSLAAQMTAKSPADGSVLLVVSASHTINPLLYAKPPYEPLTEFTFISQLARSQYLVAIDARVPANNMREFIALMKAQPGKLNYASSGNGSPPHLATELLKTMTGSDIVHIPYTGTGPIMTALLGGVTQMTFANIGGVMPHIQTGKLRGLAVSGAARLPNLPDVPTIAESGVPGFEAYGWYGLLAPAGLPAPITNRLHQAVLDAVASADVKTRFASEGMETIASTPERFRADMVVEFAKWAKVVKQINMKLD